MWNRAFWDWTAIQRRPLLGVLAAASRSIGSRMRAVRHYCWRDCVWATASCWSPASPTPWWDTCTAACLSLTAPEALAWLDRSTDARDLLARHVPVPLESQEEPAPTKRPADPDQMSLF